MWKEIVQVLGIRQMYSTREPAGNWNFKWSATKIDDFLYLSCNNFKEEEFYTLEIYKCFLLFSRDIRLKKSKRNRNLWRGYLYFSTLLSIKYTIALHLYIQSLILCRGTLVEKLVLIREFIVFVRDIWYVSNASCTHHVRSGLIGYS